MKKKLYYDWFCNKRQIPIFSSKIIAASILVIILPGWTANLASGQILASGSVKTFSNAGIVVSNDEVSAHWHVQEQTEMLLEQLLNTLEKTHQIHFGFSPRLIQDKYVDVSLAYGFDPSHPDKTLHQLLDPLNLAFEKLDNENYVIYSKDQESLKFREGSKTGRESQSSFADGQIPSEEAVVKNDDIAGEKIIQVVTGKVTAGEDEAGLPGANILIKGTNNGTVTDAEGSYKIEVMGPESVLVFSSIGYATQEVTVGERSVINVMMIADVKQLNEVVIVGYGTQKKGNITSAVATFNTEQIQERPLARVDQALVGQMAGVRVKQTSGVPGRGFNIQIRGTGSISASAEPLYVVDGFPLEPASQNATGAFNTGNPMDNINPNDIESIQVLKDAAAAAIYGSRASNGVVIIKTKSGQVGKPRITFSAYTGISEPVKKLDMMNADQWVDRAIETINYNWTHSGAGRTADQTTSQRQAILGVTTINPTFMIDDRWTQPGHPGLQYVDWQDLIFRKGVIQNYEINANGGTDAIKYFVSGGYLDQQGTAIGLGYKRFSARANIEVTASNKLKFGLNVAPSYSIASDPGVEGKDQQLHIAVSQAPVVEANVGPYNTNIGTYTNYLWGQTRNSPLAAITESIGDTKTFRTLSTVFGEYMFVKGLAFRASLNFDITNGNIKKWTPAEVTGSGPTARATTGSLAGSTRQNFVSENTLTYTKKLGEDHDIVLLAGTSYSTFRYDTWLITGSKFASDLITTLNSATQYNATSTESKSVLVSYFGRANYTFKDRYLFSASLRRDGSSRFGDATKWGVFPSASIGWIISDEGFMEGTSNTLSNLKIRASWGKAGNNVIPTINTINGDYAAISLLQFSNTSFGGKNGTGVRGMTPQNFANPNLSWETSTTINVGVDFGLIQNKISASLDYYTKDNTNLLLNIPVPIASGFSSALTNIGEVLNKGWEAELHTKNLVGRFQWNTDINFSQNTNKVKKLGPEDTPILDNGGFDIEHKIIKVGYPINSLYLVRETGVLSPEDIANGYPMYNKQEAGDPKYLDASGPNGVPDGVIDANDRVILGSPNPKYTWGIANTFKFKGFDLNVLVQGQNGGYIYSLYGRAIDRTGQGTPDNTLAKYADRWRSPDDTGAGNIHKWPSTFGRIKNTDWLYSNDYIRVRNITLGYNLATLLKTKALSAARVYVTAENLFGHDKYYGGFNPEGVNTNGEDYGAYPLSKSIIIGANLTF